MVIELPPPDVAFTVFGIPAPKGSKRAFAVGGRAMVVDDNKPALRDWTRQVNDVVQGLAERGAATLDEPVHVTVRFYMPKPKSAPKRRRTWPDRKPDLDKLIRALLDPMVKTRILADDARVVELSAEKDYPTDGDRPRAEVMVWTLRRMYPHLFPEPVA